MKNILHISDIHVSEIATTGMGEFSLKSLLISLNEDLKTLPQVDTILITGDIANSGKSYEYDVFVNNFLTPLLTELKINSSHVFMVPGNHDSNRKEWKKSDQLVKSSLIENPQQSAFEEIMQEKIGDQNCCWSTSYSNMRDSLDKEKNCLLSNKFFSAYEVDGVGIGCINSAWLSNGKDKGALIISEWQFLQIIDALKPYEQKIILMHHPLDWLHQEDKKILMNHIHSSKVSCLFFGHMHEFWMTKESLFSEDAVLKLQAGRLDTSKDGEYCGYSLVSLHEHNIFESGEIYFRKYDSKNSKFRPWDERINNGKASFSLIDALPFDPERFSSICDEIIDEIEFDLLCNTGLPNNQRKKLSEIFVLPTLVAEKEISEDAFDSKLIHATPAQYTSLNSLSDSQDSYIILGGENAGKTTLAKRLSLYYLENQTSQNLDNVVFYFDFMGKSIKNTKRLSTDLLSFYLKDGRELGIQSKLEKTLNSARAVIILDSIENLDANSLKIIFEYISKSSARFLIFGQLSIRPVLKELITKISKSDAFKFLNLKSLKRSHLKELISKWKPSTSSAQTSKVSTNALKLVNSSGMANNPFVFTMLLSIHERKSSSYRTYMHEADLVENFIEIIMQKHVIPSGNVPQYKDVLLFLGYLSTHMHENSCYTISNNELLQSALDFNKVIIQDFAVESYVDPILRSGIMRRLGTGQYMFSQICFFNYAFAYWISKSDINYPALDNKLDFIRFDKVIEYVSALKSDPKLLDYLAKKLDETWNDLANIENVTDLNDAENEILKCVGHDIIDIVKEDTLKSAFSKTHNNEHEHDEKLDKDAPLNDKPLLEVKSESREIIPIVVFHEALSLYARSFRSAEHILDAKVTNHHFSNIFRHFMNSIAFNVRAFDRDGRPEIIEHIKALVGYEKINEGKRGEIEAQVNAFINFMIAAIPNWGVVMMSSDFFNQRQRPRIENYRKQTNNNLERILLTYCLCELDDVNILEELKSQKYEKHHESSSLILKLIELIYLNFSITDSEKENLKKYAEKMVKDRKTNQLFRNYTAVSKKMALSTGILGE